MTDFNYLRYLAAKKTVDDRALNRQVFEALSWAIKLRQDSGPAAFLEVGCGIGTMVERLLHRGVLTNAVYTAIDLLPEHITAAQKRLPVVAREEGLQVTEAAGQGFLFTGPHRSLTVRLEAIDVLDFAAREAGRRAWDVLTAHAFLDLVDLDTVLPCLFSLLKPGGFFYFTLNFDGTTTFLPLLDPDLDALIEALYHQSMDERRKDGKPSGSSRTGRLLFDALPRFGGRIIAAGSSDWVVFPGPEGYPDDEAYFLHCIVHTVTRALCGHPHLEDKTLADWATRRQEQIARCELVYIAHQLDFFGVKEK